jgi:hypothetical protein
MTAELTAFSRAGKDQWLRLQRLECQVAALADAVADLAVAVRALADRDRDPDADATARRAMEVLHHAGLCDAPPMPTRRAVGTHVR